jgi:hypothetical protein
MPFGLGFFATAGAGAGAAGSFDLLETQVLGSATSSITFSSLSTYSSYQHLQIRFAGTQVDVGGLDSMAMRINGDTGSNYNSHFLRGLNSSIGSGGTGTTNYPNIGLMAGKGGSESSGMVIDFLDAFETSKYKVVRSLGGAAGTGDKGVGLYSVLWMNTNAISSITLKGQTGNLAANSRFSLYGIKVN